MLRKEKKIVMGENPNNKAPCRTCGATDRNATGRCRPCQAKKSKKYHEAHRAEANERNKRWMRDHPEKAREIAKKYRAANPNVHRRAHTKWREGHREYTKTRIKEWHAANPGAAARYARNRNARKAKDGGKHTVQEFGALLSACDGRCVYCGARADTKDHIEPLARGGSDSILNIVPACRKCNSGKGDLPMLVWMAKRGGI